MQWGCEDGILKAVVCWVSNVLLRDQLVIRWQYLHLFMLPPRGLGWGNSVVNRVLKGLVYLISDSPLTLEKMQNPLEVSFAQGGAVQGHAVGLPHSSHACNGRPPLGIWGGVASWSREEGQTAASLGAKGGLVSAKERVLGGVTHSGWRWSSHQPPSQLLPWCPAAE